MKKISRRDLLKLSGIMFIAVADGSAFRAIDQGMFSVGHGIMLFRLGYSGGGPRRRLEKVIEK